MKDLLQKKERLIERLGVYLECRDQLAPLAARIVATLILTGKQGVTFDELVANLGASKSTISTHLNNLQHTGRVTYFTKAGDRKKYFIKSLDYLVRYLDKMIENWDREKKLHVEMVNYKQEITDHSDATDEVILDLAFHKKYLTFLEQAISSMKDIRRDHTNEANND
ncbi:GbsR/MarR family transcriptional regulator [Pricia antarctica]|nr:ArsR family transcriptional regulator [Pricia antarctica]